VGVFLVDGLQRFFVQFAAKTQAPTPRLYFIAPGGHAIDVRHDFRNRAPENFSFL